MGKISHSAMRRWFLLLKFWLMACIIEIWNLESMLGYNVADPAFQTGPEMKSLFLALNSSPEPHFDFHNFECLQPRSFKKIRNYKRQFKKISKPVKLILKILN